MKRTIIWVLVLVMLCTLLTACGGQQSSPGGTTDQISSEELHEITQRLLNNLYKQTLHVEWLFGDMKWALSYLDPFFKDHSWDSLQTARAAMSLAKLKAESIEPLEEQMTFDDYDKLVRSGVNVSPSNIDQVLKDSVLVDYYLNYQTFLNGPNDTIFRNYDLTIFEHWSTLMKHFCDIYLHAFAIEIDYLILTVNSEEETALFIQAIAANCPQINALRKDNPKDVDALMEKYNSLNNEMEQSVNDLYTVIGQAQADLYLEMDIKNELNDTDNLHDYVSTLAADVVDLKDFPIALPYPDWWYQKNYEAFVCLWAEEEDSFLLPGDTIDAPPDLYFVTWADISLEDYFSYVENIEKQFKIPAQYTSEEDRTYSAYYKFRYNSQTAEFLISWEENKVSFYTFDSSVCFAPPWYIFHTRLLSS